MYSRIETITPEIAREYLTHNKNNRPLKHGAIRNYARDMRNGDWQLSPQGISFYQNGDLADGQNRLEALIKANCPVEFYVTYDVPNDSTIQDRGVSRTTSDILRMAGYSSAATSNYGVGTVNFLFTMSGVSNVSDSVRNDFIVENEELLNIATRITTHGSTRNQICKKAVVAAATFCALYCKVDADGLEDFFVVANTGFQNSMEQSAAIVLRNLLLNDYTGKNFVNKKECFVAATNAIRDFSTKTPRTRKYKANGEPIFFKYVKKQAIDKYIRSYAQGN